MMICLESMRLVTQYQVDQILTGLCRANSQIYALHKWLDGKLHLSPIHLRGLCVDSSCPLVLGNIMIFTQTFWLIQFTFMASSPLRTYSRSSILLCTLTHTHMVTYMVTFTYAFSYTSTHAHSYTLTNINVYRHVHNHVHGLVHAHFDSYVHTSPFFHILSMYTVVPFNLGYFI